MSVDTQAGASGKKKISSSDGECIVNSQGGVGVMGQYGDVSKSKVPTGNFRWNALLDQLMSCSIVLQASGCVW